MAAGQNQPGGQSRSSKLTPILVPVIGVALLVVLVVVVAAVSDAPTNSTDKGKDGASLTSGPGQPMSDGSDGGTEDPDLKPIGNAGLKYRDLKEGTGREVKPGETVVAHYTGWTTNGKVFDSSKKRGEPTEFSLLRVVEGWQQGIPGMKVGGIRKLVIPAPLGYGSRGSPPDIPPGATLIFEVEIVDVK